MKPYLQMLKFEFHLIFTCHKIVPLLIVSAIPKCKCKFVAVHNWAGGQIWPAVCRLLTPALRKESSSCPKLQ